MFDISKRGGSRNNDYEADEELEKDRFGGTAPAAPPSTGARVREAAVIGPSIHINGDLRGEEDLIIEGNVDGTIHLHEHGLTIGSKGKVKADIYAHSIVVDGKVDGDLYGSERIAIRKSGEVKGNVVSPRVSLEDGGRFKGSIEMDQQAVDSAFGGRRTQTATASQTAKPSAGGPVSGQTGKDESARPAGTGSGTSANGAGQEAKKGAAG